MFLKICSTQKKCIQTALILALMALLSACTTPTKTENLAWKIPASIPAGHFIQLDIPKSKGTTIEFLGTFPMPSTEHDVPSLFIDAQIDGNFHARLKIDDQQCTGEYRSEFKYNKTLSARSTEYYQQTIPWPEDIAFTMTLNTKNGRKYSHTLSYLGRNLDFVSREKIDGLKLQTYYGPVNITSLKHSSATK